MTGRIVVYGFNNSAGGTRTAFLAFTEFLVRAGFRVGTIVASDRRDCVQPGLEFVNYIPCSGRGLRARKVVAVARAILRSRAFRPDVFVSVGMSNVPNVISRCLGGTTYRICQDVTFGLDPNGSKITRTRASFDAIAPQAPRMERDLRRRGYAGPGLRWLPCLTAPPVPGVLATPGATRPYRLGYFGRVDRHKGVELLIEALASEPSTRDLRLDVWGDADGSVVRNAARRFGIEERARNCGRYPAGAEGAQLMASYDALALTSLDNEGLPLILLEAMAYGLPILVTNVASIPDCAEGNPGAVLIPPTLEGVMDGLRQVKSRLEAGSFSAAAIRRFYDENFSAELMERRWQECLREPEEFFSVVE